MARIWSMRFNLDTFNGAYAALDDDQDKAQFLTGFSRGLNRGALKEGNSEALAQGHLIGSQMREEAEAFSAQAVAHGAKRWKKEGTHREPTGDPKGMVEGSHEGPGLRFKVQGFPGQEKTSVLDVPGTGDTPPPREATPKKRTSAPPKPKLDAILGPKGSPDEKAYWELVKVFGGEKNPSATQSAQAFVEAIQVVPVHTILAKAKGLRSSMSDAKYMPQLFKWLDGQGYMNPDASVSSGGPMASVTDEYARYLDGGEVADAS